MKLVFRILAAAVVVLVAAQFIPVARTNPPVTGDLPAEQLSALTAQLQAADTLRSRKLTCAESVLVSSTAVLEVNAADAVVLVADCSCSRYSSVNDQKEQIARLGKTVLGCVVYE